MDRERDTEDGEGVPGYDQLQRRKKLSSMEMPAPQPAPAPTPAPGTDSGMGTEPVPMAQNDQDEIERKAREFRMKYGSISKLRMPDEGPSYG